MGHNYTPPEFVNNAIPPINATNLNALTAAVVQALDRGFAQHGAGAPDAGATSAAQASSVYFDTTAEAIYVRNSGNTSWLGPFILGESDHGALTGLSDDDHPQYAKKASNLSDLASASTARTNLGLGNAATKDTGTGSTQVAAGDHAHPGIYDPAGTASTGDAAHVAASDPHPAYLKPADVTAGTNVTVTDNGNGTITVASTGGGGGGVTDHGALTGLADDDHTQYALADGSRGSFAATGHNHSGAYQPLDSDLTSIAALTTTSHGRSLLTGADAAATRTAISAARGTGTFNVRDYGAVGDGSTDDTAAINSAIAAVNASTYGGVLYFPAGDYKVTASLTPITKPCTVRGDGRSEWYSISEAVSKISTTSTTATVLEFNARSCRVENITIHNKNYTPSALSVSPGLGGFPVPLPTALVGTLPTAGAGIKVTVGDGFSLSNVVIAGFYDNLDQVAGVNVIVDQLQSWAPVRYGHRIRNAAWVDAGGTNIDKSFYFGNPKYSQGTYGIKWESGGGLWVTATGFSGMGPPGGGGSQQTGMAYAIHSNFAAAGSSNLQVTACGIEAVEVGVYATKGATLDFFHIQIEDIQFSPWFVTSGASTCGVYIAGSSTNHVSDVRISGVFTNFPSNAGNAVSLTYVDNASLDIQAGKNGPTTPLALANCTAVINKATTATTSTPGLLPALGGGTTNFLRADGTWAAPAGGGTPADDSITNAKLANVATATIKGRTTAGTGDPEDLTAAQATALLDAFTSGAKGLAPASGGGTTNFLRADGTWAAPAGGGTAKGSDSMTVPGELFAQTGSLRLYNSSGSNRTLTKVRASVGGAPTGASGVIVDVNKNGTTIFTTQANRPTIAASSNASTAQTPDVTSWADGDYLTVDVDQAGSTYPGWGLVVTVEYTG